MIQTVKLAKLVLSDINVRTRGEDLIEQFAADISARGILQNLVVASVKKPRGSYGVIAGSRRFRALKLLAERGEINEAEYDVPVLILTGGNDELSEASLAENFHHLNMSPADECRAFQHCLGWRRHRRGRQAFRHHAPFRRRAPATREPCRADLRSPEVGRDDARHGEGLCLD